MKIQFASIFFLFWAVLHSQDNTVGLLSINRDLTQEGFNLYYPNNQSTVFLIDNCGRVINTWEDKENTRPGIFAYLTPNGTLLKAKTSGGVDNFFGAGGAGGIIEIRSWDNDLLYEKVVTDSIFRQHHDLHLMPNGNILFIAWERKFYDEIIQAGFDTTANNQTDLWFECIFELNPEIDSIVWEWHSFDHLVQEYDETKDNFGSVNGSPSKIDINYQEWSFQRMDWMHANSLDYNHALDQVLVSVRNFNELWIIDHSTSSQEAKGSTGGNSNQGGDLMFRWGNPAAYKQDIEEERMLLHQHDASWIDDPSSNYFGQLLVYNNMLGDTNSLGTMIKVAFDTVNQVYESIDNEFIPVDFSKIISHPDTAKNYSTAGSTIQLLDNGNFLMCAARQGRAFEVTDDGELVWEYLVPIRNGFPIEQGTVLDLSDNFTFGMNRYAIDFEGFEGLDIIAGPYLELNPNTAFCQLSNAENAVPKDELSIHPVPANEIIYIKSQDRDAFILYDMTGKALSQGTTNEQLNIESLSKGMYFILTERGQSRTFIKM